MLEDWRRENPERHYQSGHKSRQYGKIDYQSISWSLACCNWHFVHGSGQLLSSLFLAIAQLGDQRLRAVIWRSLAISGIIFVAILFAVGWALEGLSLFGIGWLDASVQLLGFAGIFILGLILFPGFTGIVLLFLFEDIARAVEARHYPELPKARDEPLHQTVTNALRFTLVTVGLNLLVFIIIVPLMLLTAVLAPLVPLIIYGLNGYLIGREYFELASVRRLEPQASREMQIRHKWRIFLCGLLFVGLMTIPVLNWLMPVIASTTMIHLFESLRKHDSRRGLTT